MFIERVFKEIAYNKWDKILGFDYQGQALGCSEQEIQKLEEAVGLSLPLAYKEFLDWAGNGLASFEVGSDFYYEQDLVDLQLAAREILEENNFPRKLPDDAYIFWMHNGYMFTFFCTSEGADPPVHFYRESFKEDFVWNHQAHFTDFLITELKNHARWAENSRRLQDEMARDWQNA